MPKTTRPSGQDPSGERQLAASGNALDQWAIRASLQWWETAIRQWQHLRPMGHQGKPSVVRDSYQTMATPKTTQPSGQALSGERQLAASGNALDQWAIRAGLQWWETASSQWQHLRPLGHQGRPSVVRESYQSVATPLTNRPSEQALSGERQLAASGNALDQWAIRVSLQWWETAIRQWQRLRPHSHQGRPSVVRESYQTVATP